MAKRKNELDERLDPLLATFEMDRRFRENARIREVIEKSLASIADIIRFGKERSIAPEIVVKAILPLVESAAGLAKLEKNL